MNNLRSILLIDDNKVTNFYNKKIVRKIAPEVEVLVAENGREAINVIEEKGIPEFIFLDINMPVMNGYEFLREFKKSTINYKDSTIVLMLGTELETSKIEMLKVNYGILEFSEKMLSKEKFCELLNKYINYNSVISCN